MLFFNQFLLSLLKNSYSQNAYYLAQNDFLQDIDSKYHFIISYLLRVVSHRNVEHMSSRVWEFCGRLNSLVVNAKLRQILFKINVGAISNLVNVLYWGAINGL